MTSPTLPVDGRVRPLVDALNAIPEIDTFSSCGGHANPTFSQAPAGYFYVNFVVEETAEGWRALDRLVEAVQDLATIKVWQDGGVNFEISGANNPKVVASAVAS